LISESAFPPLGETGKGVLKSESLKWGRSETESKKLFEEIELRWEKATPFPAFPHWGKELTSS